MSVSILHISPFHPANVNSTCSSLWILLFRKHSTECASLYACMTLIYWTRVPQSITNESFDAVLMHIRRFKIHLYINSLPSSVKHAAIYFFCAWPDYAWAGWHVTACCHTALTQTTNSICAEQSKAGTNCPILHTAHFIYTLHNTLMTH